MTGKLVPKVTMSRAEALEIASTEVGAIIQESPLPANSPSYATGNDSKTAAEHHLNMVIKLAEWLLHDNA